MTLSSWNWSPGVSSAEVQAESERAQLELPLKKARKHPGRQELPADLPRIEQIVACTPKRKRGTGQISGESEGKRGWSGASRGQSNAREPAGSAVKTFATDLGAGYRQRPLRPVP